MHHLVGAAEVGRMLGGVSRQRVQQLVKRADFPAPVVELDMGKVWNRADVEAWLRRHGRDVPNDPESAQLPARRFRCWSRTAAP